MHRTHSALLTCVLLASVTGCPPASSTAEVAAQPGASSPGDPADTTDDADATGDADATVTRESVATLPDDAADDQPASPQLAPARSPNAQTPDASTTDSGGGLGLLDSVAAGVGVDDVEPDDVVPRTAAVSEAERIAALEDRARQDRGGARSTRQPANTGAAPARSSGSLASGRWHAPQAQSRAEAEARRHGKPIMIFFTGSDWCGWCMRLDEEVLSTSEFRTWSRENVVLVKADFPHHRELSAAEEQAADRLSKTYKIEGFPTVVFVNEIGGPAIGTLGYQEGGAQAWLQSADRILARAQGR